MACNPFFAMLPIGFLIVLIWGRLGGMWGAIHEISRPQPRSIDDSSRRKYAVRRPGREKFVNFWVVRLRQGGDSPPPEPPSGGLWNSAFNSLWGTSQNGGGVSAASGSGSSVLGTGGAAAPVASPPRPPQFEVKLCITQGVTIDKVKERASQALLEEGCSICLQGFSHTHPITLVPCGHLYHAKCLRRWLVLHTTCPSCRADFNADFDDDGNAVDAEGGGGGVVDGDALSADVESGIIAQQTGASTAARSADVELGVIAQQPGASTAARSADVELGVIAQQPRAASVRDAPPLVAPIRSL